MSKQETQNQQEKKTINGNWVLLLFGVLFALVMLMGFLRN